MEQQASNSVRRAPTPHVDPAAACGCGQDLDRVGGTHCPRCGTQLGVPRFEAVGFWRAA